jgi:lathosterol oxidase
MLFDAFDGDFLDTVFMILIPLYSTCMTMAYLLGRDVSVWSYMIFGSLYANYLCLIHSEYEHPWDGLFMKLGIGTPADHHVHHKLFNRNFGHLFMYWDKMFGTYTDPRSVPKHFVKTF